MGHRCEIGILTACLAVSFSTKKRHAAQKRILPRHQPVIMKRAQRKNWGSVHHTAYILLRVVRNVKYYETKIPRKTGLFSTFSPKAPPVFPLTTASTHDKIHWYGKFAGKAELTTTLDLIASPH